MSKLTIPENLPPLLQALHYISHSSGTGQYIILNLGRSVLKQRRKELKGVEPDVEVLNAEDRKKSVEGFGSSEEEIGVEDTEILLTFGEGRRLEKGEREGRRVRLRSRSDCGLGRLEGEKVRRGRCGLKLDLPWVVLPPR